jgi:phenylalanyl-tRNA synthetase beta chain
MLVVGKILNVEKHPNADKLVVTQVDLGGGGIVFIVTNDATIKVQDKVVVATIGHQFEQFNIEQRKVRGIESFGMFCGHEVTGIEGEGVTRLSEDAIVGSEFVK